MGKTLVIAEFGANHNRDWDTAIKGIDAAVEAKADIVKFQTYTAEGLFAKQDRDINGISDIHSMFKDIELPREWQKDLKAYCDDKGIEFMSTPFDEEAVQQLVDLGVKRLKISGFESSDPRFVEMVCSTGLPIIMSVGIGFPINYMGKFIDIFERYNNHVTLLHCVNAYPTPMNEINLNGITALSNFKGIDAVGLSDHTQSVLTPALAVAKGATVIEKHFTLDRNMKGPDHSFAMEPHELKEMVRLIRQAEETIQGSGNTESKFIHGKRSVVAACDIKVGEYLNKSNTTTKRPCYEDSVPAIDYNEVMGEMSYDFIAKGTIIKKSNIPGYYELRPANI